MQEYPLIGSYQPVDVRGDYGRPMLKHARYMAPEPCINCPNLCLSRIENRAQDVLHCKNPVACPSLVPLGKSTPPPDQYFLDESPSMPGYLSGDSPCWSCTYKEQIQSGAGTLEHCNRRRDGLELCTVRGSMNSLEYAQYKIDLEQKEAREAQERQERELEHEMELIESIDLTDYGSF